LKLSYFCPSFGSAALRSFASRLLCRSLAASAASSIPELPWFILETPGPVF
jgi:hypothetical protein